MAINGAWLFPLLWLCFLIYSYVSPNSSVLNINVRLVAMPKIQMFYQNNKSPRRAVGFADSVATLFLEIEVVVEFRAEDEPNRKWKPVVSRSCVERGGNAHSGSFKSSHLILSLLGNGDSDLVSVVFIVATAMWRMQFWNLKGTFMEPRIYSSTFVE